ncbi:hypothetical protein Lser_V15G00117 [Lactuca serriola]
MSSSDYEPNEDFDEEIEIIEQPPPLNPVIIDFGQEQEPQHLNPNPDAMFDLWVENMYYRDLANWLEREIKIKYRRIGTIVVDKGAYIKHVVEEFLKGVATYVPKLRVWMTMRPRLVTHLATETNLMTYGLWLRHRYPIQQNL